MWVIVKDKFKLRITLGDKEIKNEKINQHCSRATLIVHSKKLNENYSKDLEKDVFKFV